MQEAYVAVWQKAARFDRARGSAMSWLAVLTRNAAIDRFRNQRRNFASHSEDMIEIADPSPIAFDVLTASQETRRLHDCLDGLDPIEAGFLRTAFFQGMSYADLAKREDLPLGTVKSRIRRSLLKMRERLS